MISVRTTDPRRKVFELFIEGHIQADVARILDISAEAQHRMMEYQSIEAQREVMDAMPKQPASSISSQIRHGGQQKKVS